MQKEYEPSLAVDVIEQTKATQRRLYAALTASLVLNGLLLGLIIGTCWRYAITWQKWQQDGFLLPV